MCWGNVIEIKRWAVISPSSQTVIPSDDSDEDMAFAAKGWEVKKKSYKISK